MKAGPKPQATAGSEPKTVKAPPEQGFTCGRGRRRSGDLALFSCPQALFGVPRRTAADAKALVRGMMPSALVRARSQRPRDVRGIGELWIGPRTSRSTVTEP